MPDESTRDALIEGIATTRDRWRRLVADVGPDRVDEPGPMGEWTFKDVAAHLTAWRRRTVSRLEAAARGERDAAPPWPRELIGGEDDPINAWIHDENKDRPATEVLRESEAVYDDLVAAVQAFPIAALQNPGRFPWLEGSALADFDPGLHLAEHEPDVRRWLAER